ncbi:MAG: tail fiber domain-containing protein [Candidatus Kapabacteria bacterium]|nr:tail fiber domain-containing protein [Candidatus Kapabacteria bacterium]
MRRMLLVGAVLSAALVGASAQVGSLINYGAIIKDSVRLENAGAFLRLPADGLVRWGDHHVGTLQSASLTAARTWTLPNETGTLLTSVTTFGAAGASDATVSGTYNALDIQLKSGSVGSSEIADGSIAPADVGSGTYGISITGTASNVTGTVAIANGGTGATTAPGARTNLGAAASGINTDITALQGLNQQNAVQVGPYGTNAGETGEIRFLELAANGTNYVGFKAPDAIGSNVIWRLPAADGSSGQFLTTDGSGNLSWASPSGTVPNGTAAGQLLIWSGTAWQAHAMSGDATINATGLVTIANNAVTSAKILDGTIATADLANNAVTSAKIDDGTIVNADISATAAIAVSKLAAGSDGQVLVTSGSTPTWSNLSTVETDPQVGTLSDGQVAFWSGSASALTGSNDLFWDATNSRLGIGTSNPQSRLHVHGTNIQVTNSSTGSGTGDGFLIQLSGSDVQLRQNENGEIQFRTNAGGGSDTVRMRLTADGMLVFFNTGTPSYRIDLPNSSATNVGMGRARAWVAYSSVRWKEDIRPLGNALEKVLAMRGVQYRWKPEYGGNEDIGFIAEEVGEVLPWVVQRDSKGEYIGMDYMRVVPVLVEALKEEHRRNEELRQKVAQLEKERSDYATLQAELSELRRLVEFLSQRLDAVAGRAVPVPAGGDWLGSNVPNPHDGTTTIPYYVPEGVARAQLIVTDRTGRVLRMVELLARQAWSSVVLDMRLLPSGTYEYSLLFDGRIVATRQMQLVK